jgi:hypothetical protein
MSGRLSRIDLRVPTGSAGEAILARVRAALPADLTLLTARAQAR